MKSADAPRSTAGRGASALLGHCSPAANKLQYQYDQGDQKQNVDIGAQHMEANESQQP
jgi:hypothetical protein